jgi:hypothetical protein
MIGTGWRASLGEAFRRIVIAHLADNERVEADDLVARQADIGLRRARLLIGKGKAN